MLPSTLAPQWPILVSLCGINHQKSTILFIFGTLSVGGCGGHGCYFQLNLMVINSPTNSFVLFLSEQTLDHQKSTILWIFVTFSLGGCGGHLMRPKLNLKSKSQMPLSHKHVGSKKLAKIKMCTLTRKELLFNLCYEIPCSRKTRLKWY